MKKTQIPENFEVSPRIMELAKKNGWPDPHNEVEAFKDYHLAHGKLMLDWEAAFRLWLRNAQRWNKQPARPLVQPQKQIVAQHDKEISLEERRRNLHRVNEIIKGLAGIKHIK
jgi:hypothetical protein